MKTLLAVYRAQIKTSFLMYLQYRAWSVLWLLDMVLEPVIYLVVWSTIARTNGGAVDGYRTGDFAAYFLVLLLVNHLTDNWVYYEFQERVRQGLLSPLLLRPIHPIHADVAQNMTYKFIALVVMLPTVGVLAFVFHPTVHVTWLMLLLFFPSLLLAISIRFLVEWSLGLTAFWTMQMNVLRELAYRGNFYTQIFQSLVSLGFGLLGLVVIFDHTSTLNEWHPAQILALLGVYQFVGGVINLVIQPCMQQLMREVHQGTLDFTLLKPADAQFLVSIPHAHLRTLSAIVLAPASVCFTRP